MQSRKFVLYGPYENEEDANLVDDGLAREERERNPGLPYDKRAWRPLLSNTQPDGSLLYFILESSIPGDVAFTADGYIPFLRAMFDTTPWRIEAD